MTHERSQNPGMDPSAQQIASEDILRNVRWDPNVTTEHLSPNRPVAFQTHPEVRLNGSTNDKLGIQQELLAIVDAGEVEAFGVVRITDLKDPESPGAIVLTRLTGEPTARAEIITRLDEGETSIVGRTMLGQEKGQKNINGKMSRKHFGVGLQSGYLVVEDLDASNGTAVMTPNSATGQRAQSLNNFKQWSAPGRVVQAFLDGRTVEQDPPLQELGLTARRDAYEMPSNQTETELALIDAYNERHPNERFYLDFLLHSVGVATGSDPGLKLEGKIEEGQLASSGVDASLIDEDGYFKTSGQPIFTRMFLAKNPEVTLEEFNAMTHAEQMQVQAQKKGLVAGTVPEAINDAFDAIFELTGAQKIRDDRDEGLPSGSVVWKGMYQGKTFYVDQQYDQAGHSSWDNLPALSALAWGEEGGERLVDDLRGDDFKRLLAIGMSPREINDGVFDGVIKHSTVDGIIGNANELDGLNH